MAITLQYTSVASLVEANLKATIMKDLRQRLMKNLEAEVDAAIQEVVGDIVTKVSEVKGFGIEGITLQVAINGVRRPRWADEEGPVTGKMVDQLARGNP